MGVASLARGLVSIMAVVSLAGCQLRSRPEESRTPAPATEAASQTATVSSFTMGTYVTVQATATTAEKAQEAADAAIRALSELSDEVDRFLPASPVSRINQAAGNGQWVTVSPRLFTLLQKAKQAAELTDGAFDPTVGPLVDLWGFVEVSDTQAGSGSTAAGSEDETGTAQVGPAPIVGRKPPSQEAIERVLPLVNYHDLELDAATHSARLRRRGQVLDLGGIAKGYGAELAARMLQESGVTQGLVDLGGNIFALGHKPDGTPWRAGIKDPRNAGALQAVAVLPVADTALATSGDYERYFIYEGVRYSHLLDPHTGYPARSVMSATVITPDGAMGDALSTAAFVVGPEKGPALLSKAGAEGIWIRPDFSVIATPGIRPEVELRGRAHWAQ
ncbi:MAG: FAD:protein FMN transferase [Limnochordaceae bacterium]|nr:FAD:protein FMN transferase [Limnochordaceae bacterium]